MSKAEIIIRKINETYIHIQTHNGIRQEISNEFCFEVPNAKHMKLKGKNRNWDGKIRLFQKRYNRIYAGLLPKILEFAKQNNYTVDNQVSFPKKKIDIDAFHQFVLDLNLPHILEEHQYHGILKAIEARRKVILSATGSGKSLMTYVISKWFDCKTLIIVPTIALVKQSKIDLISYGADPEDIHCIQAGQPKTSRKPLVISTWQSIYNADEKIFENYELIIGDECFVEGMKVLTPSGYIEIEKLKNGDRIINYDEQTKTFKTDIIIKLHKNISNEEVFELNFDNGSTIQVTGNHPFLTKSGWKKAKQLTENDEIINTQEHRHKAKEFVYENNQ